MNNYIVSLKFKAVEDEIAQDVASKLAQAMSDICKEGIAEGAQIAITRVEEAPSVENE